MPGKEATTRSATKTDMATVTVWRKMPVGEVTVGNGSTPFESAVLMTIAETVHADADRKAHAEMDRDRRPREREVLTDQFEAEFQGHRVQVRLGDAVDIER